MNNINHHLLSIRTFVYIKSFESAIHSNLERSRLGVKINIYDLKKMTIILTLILIFNIFNAIFLNMQSSKLFFEDSNFIENINETLLDVDPSLTSINQITTTNRGSNEFIRDHSMRGYDIELESGWATPPDYVTIPEPKKAININLVGMNMVSFNFTVYNHGENGTIGFNVTLPDNWTYKPIQDIYLENGTNSTNEFLNLTVFPPLNRENLPNYKWLSINLTAYVKNASNVKDWVTFFVWIDTFWPYPILTPPENKTVKPNITIINCSIINDGNNEDNFELSAKMGFTEFERSMLESQGWMVSIYSGSITRILKRHQSFEFQVKFTVPQSEDALTLVPVTIKAKSIKNPYHPDSISESKFNVTVGIYNSITLHKTNRNIEYNETPKRLNITLTNTGNYLNDNFEVVVTQKPVNWSLDLDMTNIPKNGLEIGQNAEFWIIILVPKTELEGWYQIELTGRSFSDYDDGIDSENNLTLSIYVPRISNLTLELLDDIKVGNPGETIYYIIRVRNLGNSQEYIVVWTEKVIGNNYFFNLEINFGYYLIEANEYIDIRLNISLHENIPADPNPDTPELENYAIKLACESIFNLESQEMQIPAQILIEFKVNLIHNFSIESIDNQQKYIKIVRTQDMTSDVYNNYTFKINNYGNCFDSIILSLSGPEWVQINSTKINLSYQKTAEFQLVLNFNSIPELGNYKLNISGVSEYNNSIVDNYELWLMITDFDIYIPKLEIDGKNLIETDLKVGSTKNFYFEIKKNQSYNYLSTEPRQIRVTIYLVTANGSFSIIEVFNITADQIDQVYKHSFNYSFKSEGWFIILIRADLANGSKMDENNLENNKIFINLYVVKSISEDKGPVKITFEYFIIISLILIIVVLLSILLLIERTRYSLLRITNKSNKKDGSDLIKINRGETEHITTPQFFDDPSGSKNRIFTYIKLNPGVQYTELKLQSEVSGVKLIQILEDLIQEKFIIKKPKGINIRFYPSFSDVKQSKN